MVIVFLLKTYMSIMAVIITNVLLTVTFLKELKIKKWLKKLEKTQKKDEIKKDFLITQGLKYVSIQECEFIKNLKPKTMSLYNNYLPTYYQKNRSTLSQSVIIEDIRKGLLFGAVEVEKAINDNFYEYFKEYPPFYVPATFQ